MTDTSLATVRDGSAAGPQQSRAGWRTGAAPFLIAAAVVLAGWPYVSVSPPGSLDDSYFYTLALWMQGEVGGVAIAFPYGPLGALNWLYAFDRSIFALQLLFAVLVLYSLGLLVLRRATALLGLPVATVLAWFVVTTSVTSGLVEAACLAAFLLTWEKWDGTVAPRLAAPVLWLSAPVLMAVRPTTGLLVVGLIGLDLLRRPRSRAAALLGVGAAAVFLPAAIVAVWAATGVPLSEIPGWLAAIGEFGDGYSVVALEEQGRQIEYLYAAAVLAVLVALTTVVTRGLGGWERLVRGASVAGFLYLDFRHGFVRHDGHSVAFFSAGLVLAVGVAGSAPVGPVRQDSRERSGRRAAVLLPAALLLVLTVPYVPSLDPPLAGAPGLVRQVGLVVSGDQWRAQVAADDRALRGRAQVPDALLARIGRETVDVQPYESVLARSYDLNYRPVPLIQPFTAFTTALDALNADAVEDGSAARFLLRRADFATLDGRYGPADSGAYQLAVACRYREVSSEGGWQLLERGPTRCGPERVVEQVTVEPGTPTVVPRVPAGSVLLARITLDPGRSFTLANVMFKPPSRPQLVIDGASYRHLWTAPGQPTILRLPPTLAPFPGAPGGLSAEVVTIEDVTGPVTFSFSVVPVVDG